MRNFIFTISTISFLLLVPVAKAGFLLEPDLGIVLTSEFNDQDSDNLPITIGGRVGYQFLGAMFGLDYHQTPSSKFELTGGGTGKYDLQYYGAFVGYNFPILLRAWATLVVNAKFDMPGYDAEGDGYKLGVGFTGLPFISINLEMMEFNFDEYGPLDVDWDYKAYALSVSLPLDL